MNPELFYTIVDLSDVSEVINFDVLALSKAFPESNKKSAKSLNNFYLARKALLLAAKEGYKIQPLFKNAHIINHHYIANNPQKITSLAHTDDCGVAVVTSLDDYRSVGIDIELTNRVIPKNSQRYFKTSKDSDQWSDLQLWVLKEACFKCIQPLWKRLHFNSNMVLNDIAVNLSRTKKELVFKNKTGTLASHR